MSLASPYLISLGLSKSLMSLVFVAGPLSGLVMQPLVGELCDAIDTWTCLTNHILGAFSDRCTSRFGRRRPYLFGGTVISTCALLLLGYTKSVSSIFGLSDEHVRRPRIQLPTPFTFHLPRSQFISLSLQRNRLTIWLAVLSIYFIDFSVNAIMASLRAILVDVLPASDQELANAWAGRMSGVGSIAGFFVSVRR